MIPLATKHHRIITAIPQQRPRWRSRRAATALRYWLRPGSYAGWWTMTTPPLAAAAAAAAAMAELVAEASAATRVTLRPCWAIMTRHRLRFQAFLPGSGTEVTNHHAPLHPFFTFTNPGTTIHSPSPLKILGKIGQMGWGGAAAAAAAATAVHQRAEASRMMVMMRRRRRKTRIAAAPSAWSGEGGCCWHHAAMRRSASHAAMESGSQATRCAPGTVSLLPEPHYLCHASHASHAPLSHASHAPHASCTLPCATAWRTLGFPERGMAHGVINQPCPMH